MSFDFRVSTVGKFSQIFSNFALYTAFHSFTFTLIWWNLQSQSLFIHLTRVSFNGFISTTMLSVISSLFTLYKRFILVVLKLSRKWLVSVTQVVSLYSALLSVHLSMFVSVCLINILPWGYAGALQVPWQVRGWGHLWPCMKPWLGSVCLDLFGWQQQPIVS